jgi:hypothetical protein
MGSPPPTDGPAPTLGVSAGFAPGPPAAILCGYALPTLRFKIGFKLPKFPFSFPPKIPLPFLSLGLNCDLNNPINISAGLKPGGGRASNGLPDPDVVNDNQ